MFQNYELKGFEPKDSEEKRELFSTNSKMSAVPARPKSITRYALQKAAQEGKFVNIKTASALSITGAETAIKKDNRVYIADPAWPVAGTWDEINVFFAAQSIPVETYGQFLRYDRQTLEMTEVRQRFDAAVARAKALKPRKTQQEIQEARRIGSMRNNNALAEWARMLSLHTVKCEPYIRPRNEVQVRPRTGRTRTGPVSWTTQYGEVAAERQQKPATHSNYVLDVTNYLNHPGANSRTKTFGVKAIRKSHYQGGTKFALPGIYIMSTNAESYRAFLQLLLNENPNLFGGRTADQITQEWLRQKPAVTTRNTVRSVAVMPPAMPAGQVPQMPSIPAGGLTAVAGVQRVASPGPQPSAVMSVSQQPPQSPRIGQGYPTSAPMSANFMTQMPAMPQPGSPGSLPAMPQIGSPSMMPGSASGYSGAF